METPETVWLTVTEIAKRPGNGSKANVSKKVKRLRDGGDLKDGVSVRLNARGHVEAVDVAVFESLVASVGDQSKAPVIETLPTAPQALPTDSAVVRGPEAGTLNHAKLQAQQIAAKKAAIELAQLRGHLCRLDLVREYGRDLGTTMLESLAIIPAWAEDIADAMEEGGEPRVRKVLEAKVRELQAILADAFAAREKDLPEGDPEPPLEGHLLAAE